MFANVGEWLGNSLALATFKNGQALLADPGNRSR